MCFYDQEEYICTDWKWGHFRGHCNKEYRTGETCGMKLVYQKLCVPRKCTRCEAVDTKLRERQELVERIERWQQETRYPASVERGLEELAQLDEQIKALYDGISRNRSNQANLIRFTRGVSNAKPIPRDDEHSKVAGPTKREPQIKTARKYNRICKDRGLPITFITIENPATVVACPDTGVNFNAISLELANLLCLPISFEASRLSIRPKLPNGKEMQPYGRILTRCEFGVESHMESLGIACEFVVFTSLVEPGLMMGRRFLGITATLFTNLHRVIRLPQFLIHTPSIRSIGCPPDTLYCCINGKTARAVADTGSDYDLMSERFALDRKFEVIPRQMSLSYADKTQVETRGVVKAELLVGNHVPAYEDFHVNSRESSNLVQDSHEGKGSNGRIDVEMEDDSCRRVVETEFYVVPDLEMDAYIGSYSLETLQAFRLNPDDFESLESLDAPNFGRIIASSKASDALNRGIQAIHRLFDSTSVSPPGTDIGSLTN